MKATTRGTMGVRAVKGGPMQSKPRHSNTLGKGGSGGGMSMKSSPQGPAVRGSKTNRMA